MATNESITFARKYRPKTMDEYMGEAIKNTIKSRFRDPRGYPHAILLSGSRGTGKTSMARLIAKEYLYQEKKPGEFACGKCWACKEIEDSLISGGNPIEGVQELNIATDGGKGAIEGILEDAVIPPMPPVKYKIIILDECHMATNQAQNALLKIVEEPPEHLVFIFCTTNPEKMIVPLKSRCQVQLEVKRPTVDELAQYLLNVCKAEGITTSLDALRIIAKKAERIPREALSKLEGVAIEYAKRVTVDNVRKSFAEVSTQHYITFYKAANAESGRLDKLMRFIGTLKAEDIACRDFLKGLIRFTLDCMYIKYGIGTDDFPAEFAKEAKKLFSMYDTNDLDTLTQVLEYAMKLAASSDDTQIELLVITTGLRIGKVRTLALGLQNTNAEASFENNMSVQKHSEQVSIAGDGSATKFRTLKDLDDTIMADVFGAELIEVKTGDTGNMPSLDIKDDEDEETIGSENTLLSFLRDCGTAGVDEQTE